MIFNFNGFVVCLIVILLLLGNWIFIDVESPEVGILLALVKFLHKKLLADPESIKILVLMFLPFIIIKNVVVIVEFPLGV